MNRVKQLRKERNMTLRELSQRLNMALTTLSSIESGQNDLTADKLKLFADYFDVSSDYLLGRTEIRNPNKSNISFALGGLEAELADKDKEMIMNLAQSLADKNRGGGNL